MKKGLIIVSIAALGCMFYQSTCEQTGEENDKEIAATFVEHEEIPKCNATLQEKLDGHKCPFSIPPNGYTK